MNPRATPPQRHCTRCQRLVSVRRVSAFRGGGVKPYPHTKGAWTRGPDGKLSVPPEMFAIPEAKPKGARPTKGGAA